MDYIGADEPYLSFSVPYYEVAQVLTSNIFQNQSSEIIKELVWIDYLSPAAPAYTMN